MVKENYAKIGDLGCFKYYDPEESADADKKQLAENRKTSEAGAQPEPKTTNSAEQQAAEKSDTQQASEGKAKQEEMKRMDSLFK